MAVIIFSVCVSRHTQITQNKKFAISLYYFKKELSNEVDFLHAGKHESLLQTDSKRMVKNFQSSHHSKFAMSLQYLKKEVKTDVDFLHAEFPKSLFQHFEHQSFLQG